MIKSSTQTGILQTSSSQNPIVAVVGTGYWGKNLVRNFEQLNALGAICDNQSSILEHFAIQYPNVSGYLAYSELLHNPAIQAVAIATPAETHYRLVEEALLADKDVFVEKPLALTYEQGTQLVQLAETRGRILMVGHVLEYHPAVRRLLDLVRTGELGKIQYIYSNRLSLGKVRREENILWSFAPHDIAIILRLMAAMPFQAAVCGGTYIQPNIADVTVTNLLFDNGVRAHIHVSWLHPFKEQRLIVIGSRKMASFDDVAKELVLYDKRVEIQAEELIPIKGQGDQVDFSADEPLRLECQAFLNAIDTRQSPLTDGHSGLRVLKVLQAAQRSLVMNGEPVSLPLETASMSRTYSMSNFEKENLYE